MKIITIIIINVVLINFIVGCSSIPRQDNNEGSVIAIKIDAYAKEGILATGPLLPIKVFFIRLENDNELINKDIIESTMTTDTWLVGKGITYLFNVEPGRYAAVAVYGTGHVTSRTFFIMFSEQLIKSTIVDVEPGTFVYMGEFVTYNIDISCNELSDGCEEIDEYYYDGKLVMERRKKLKCDEIQKYYHHYFSSNDNSGSFSFLFSKELYYCGSLKKKFVSKDDKIEFLKSKSKEFNGTQWENNIKSTLQSLEAN